MPGDSAGHGGPEHVAKTGCALGFRVACAEVLQHDVPRAACSVLAFVDKHAVLVSTNIPFFLEYLRVSRQCVVNAIGMKRQSAMLVDGRTKSYLRVP